MFRVYPLYTGKILADEVYHFYGQQPGNEIFCPSYIYYIENLETKEKILVDTSFDSPEQLKAVCGFKCEREPGNDVQGALAQIGVKPADIDLVVFTHLHWDHVGNLDLFEKAVFICQHDELGWFYNPPSWAVGYLSALAPQLFKIRNRIRAVSGNNLIRPGLEVIKLGGHSPGSQAIIVETEKGKVAIAGDVIPRYRNMEENLPSGLLVNLEDCCKALQTLRKEADVVLPSHDWRLYEEVKGGGYW